MKRNIFGKSTSQNESAIALTLILLLSVSAVVATIPLSNAHDPAWNIPTYAYMSVIPSTQQVNNAVQVVMWLNTVVPTAGGLGGDRWHNFTLTITSPDGAVETLGPYDSDQVGTKFLLYTPTQTGEYKMRFSWPGQVLTSGTGVPYAGGLVYVGDTFEGAESSVVTLIVQQEPIPTWENTPAPTGYWELPVNSLNRDNWGALASNWLGGSYLKYNFQTLGQAPNSAHVLWQTPIPNAPPGGILDAQTPTVNANIRDYETPFYSSYGAYAGGVDIIMNGVLYIPTPQMSTTTRYGYYAIDLYTGEQLWYNNGSSIPANLELKTGPGGSYMAGGGGGAATAPALSVAYPQLACGQLYQYSSANGKGTAPYLWATAGTTWYMLDAGTGNWILTIKNVPSGTSVVDQSGDLLIYSYNSANGNLLCWNSSQCIPPAGPVGTAQQQWRPPIGATIDALNDTTWTNYPIPVDFTATMFGGGAPQPAWSANQVRPRSGYTMNVTIQSGLVGISQVLLDNNRVPQEIFGWSNPSAGIGLITGGNGIAKAWCAKINYHAAPYSPYPNETYTQNNNLGYTVDLLWQKTYQPPVPTGNITYELGPVDFNSQVFTVWSKETRQWYGYSLVDGSMLWGPTASEADYNIYNAVSRMDAGGASTAYGNLYSGGYGGTLYCYDTQTGNLIWNYTAKGISLESPYGNYPLNIGAIADGKVYAYTDLGYVQQPLWRGAEVCCIDAYAGTEVWGMYGWAIGGVLVANGYAIYADQYNNMINCIGKGPSATTVTTQDFAASIGTPVLVKGTVTDQSPGTTCWGFPAAGTPAISDADMDVWMEYLYCQQSKPADVNGVPVHLTAIDPNGNTQGIGTVVSDITGSYAISWAPPVPGVYTITARFEGSNSYGDSSAQTSLLVSESAAATVPSTSSPTQSTGSQTQAPATTTSPVSPSPSQAEAPQPTSGIPATTYIAIAAAVIIIAVVAAAVLLRRRK
jgi:outer membrane protein assembly factor BamB